MRPSNPKVHQTTVKMTKDISATSKKSVSEERTLKSEPQEKLLDDDYCESNVDSGFLSGSLSLKSSEFDIKTETDEGLTSRLSKSQLQEEVCAQSTSLDEVLEAYTSDQDGDTHLHLAIIQGLPEVVSHIISLAPESRYLNFINDLYQTPLYLAVLTRQPKIVRKLVAAGADINIRDRRGNTALHLACSIGDIGCVKQLTLPPCSVEVDPSRLYEDLHQNLDLKNYDGISCMHLATGSGNKEIVHHLALHGADVNIMDGKSGWTPLHYSVQALNQEMTKFLLEKCKADPKVQNYKSLTPLSLIRSLYSCKSKNTYRRALAIQELLCRYDSTRASSSDGESDSDVSYAVYD